MVAITPYPPSRPSSVPNRASPLPCRHCSLRALTDAELVVPYDAGSAIGEIHKIHVLSESYEGDGVHYRVRAPKAAIDRLRAMLRSSPPCTRYSYYAWAKSTGFGWRPPTVLVGVILLIGWVVCLRLTLRSIGGLGLLPANAFLAAFSWMVASWGWLPIENVAAISWLGLFSVAAIWRSACRGRTGAGRGQAPRADQPFTSPLGHQGLACVLRSSSLHRYTEGRPGCDGRRTREP